MNHFNYKNINNGNDVDRVLFESQNPSTIEPVHECDNSFFSNPINDFWSEMNEYGKVFCSDPTLESPKTLVETKSVNSDWNIHDTAYTSNNAYEFSAVNEMQNCGPNSIQQSQMKSPDFGERSLNESTDQSFLTNKPQEFISTDYAFLGTEYSSTLNQWFLNLDQQQQIAYKNVTPITNTCQQEPATISDSNNGYINNGSTFNQNYSESINTIVSLPSFTTINSIPTIDNNYINRPPNLVNNQIALDVTHSSINNENNSTHLLPMSVKNSIHQDSFSDLISAGKTQPFLQTNLCSTSDNQNIITLSNVQSVSNISCLQSEKCLSIVEPVYQSKTLKDQPLYSKGPHNVAFKEFEKANSLNWTTVFPREHFIQPPEMIILHPLRTRNLITSRRITTSNIDIGSDAAITPVTATIVPLPVSSTEVVKSFAPLNSLSTDAIPYDDKHSDKNYGHVQKSCNKETDHHGSSSLLEYFESTSINIPMIKERPRADGKNENRRKQKLHIIPGAENLIFEVQQSGDIQDIDDDIIQTQTTISEINKALNLHKIEDLYPETESSELDEIFRRKKKSNDATAAGSKRTYQISSSISVGNGCDIRQKKLCPNSKLQQSEPATSIKESSYSFEDNISVPIAICKETSNFVVDKTDLTFASESESVDTIYEDDNNGQSQAGRPLKCNQCKKLFKTTRSLVIHTKRCVNLNQQNVVAIQGGNINNPNNFKADDVEDECEISKRKTDSGKLFQSPKSSLKSNDIQKLNLTSYMRNEEIPTTSFLNMIPNQKTNPRPITRSQTRRSTGRSIPYSTVAKLSK